MTDTKQKLYVLVGHDHNNAFEGMVKALEERGKIKGDVVILRAKPDQTISDLTKTIKGPANVMVAAHGEKDATFEWNNGQKLPYANLFHALPRTGVSSVIIAGCYGESAKIAEAGRELPVGAVLQSVVGSKVPGWSTALTQYGTELGQLPELNRSALLIEALDNTDPQASVKLAKAYDAAQRMKNPLYKFGQGIADYKASDVLPHTISIGGKPPIALDLDIELANLSGRMNDKARQDTFRQAVKYVRERFDANAGEGTGNEIKLQARIEAVAYKLGHGTNTEKLSLEEKRIGYAITAAYLEGSGEMDRVIAQEHARANGTLQRKAITVEWDGKGNKTIAQIQAIAEVGGIGTDDGGARDNKVTGQNNQRTQRFIREMSDALSIVPGSDPKYEKLLHALSHNPQVLASFATIKDANNAEMASIVFTPAKTPDAPKHGR